MALSDGKSLGRCSRFAAIAAVNLALLIPGIGVAGIHTSLPGYRIAGDRSEGELIKAIAAKLKETGEEPYAMSELATYLYRNGQVDQAKALWDKAAAKERNLPPADVEIVFELLDQGKVTTAQAALARAMTRYPNSPHVLLAEAQLALSIGDREHAEKTYQKAAGVGGDLMVTNVTLGRFYEFTGDAELARKHYQRATTLSNRPEAWILLATNDFQQGSFDRALEELRSASKADPKQPPAEARLAELFLRASDIVGAHEWFSEALRQSPKDVECRTRLGQVYRLLNRNEDARREFHMVLKLEETLGALVGLAQLEEETGNSSEAERLYRRTLAVDPDNIIACNNLAMLLFQQDRQASEARSLIDTALRLMPNHSSVQSTHGCILLMAKDFQGAHDVLAKAVRSVPSDAWTRYAYGMSLWSLKSFEPARQQLRGCLLLDPKFPRRAEIDRILGNQIGQEKQELTTR